MTDRTHAGDRECALLPIIIPSHTEDYEAFLLAEFAAVAELI